uniref:Solute carrier family 12 member 9 n=1 Tax=Tetraodon nigroviridis TaxID=99883 RepID=H3CGQ7_TETNG
AMSERAPLLHYRLTGSTGPEPQDAPPRRTERRGPAEARKHARKLGVVVPTLLSMFSVVVFLRVGFVVGQAGLYQSITMFLVAYCIITMTVLSICAISTNGALDAGGAYYMISRALGPEFGGSIGIMFFFANVCSSALYILGVVEAIVSDFGVRVGADAVTSVHQVFPTGYWWSLLYGTTLLFLCFIVCLVGAHIYAKATFIVFIIVTTVLVSVFISFFIVGPLRVTLPVDSVLNGTSHNTANYSGFSSSPWRATCCASYTVDYTTGAVMSFATVFAVMFNGCTGIMAGSNMSGDLKNPSYSIPRGTMAAVIITFITYNLLALLAAWSCDRHLLQRDYGFLGDVNVWPPLVKVGIYSSSLSAAMSNLIGASRILYALSKDNLFDGVLALTRKTSHGGNPWASVLVSWIFAQVVLFAGKLNTIASVVTIFFLLVYAAVNLACLALEWASAPNFRPSFRCFTWHTCALGILGCLVMMFLINAIYAFVSIVFMLLLLMLIQYLGPISNWGYISQALIFHQVRKYLLMLDVRKDHVKFWRLQVLLMVANPRGCTGLMAFINDLKKSGLYVLGHVKMGLLACTCTDGLPSDPLQSSYDSWLSLVDHLNIKAFVNLTLADSVRRGVQNLLFITGFGSMRPNTLVLGYDDCAPQDHLQVQTQTRSVDPPRSPVCEGPVSPKISRREEYVSVIADALKLGKNIILARYFSQFNREEALGGWDESVTAPFIDLWPLNLLSTDSRGYVDVCSLFLLQLASVLRETRAWSQARLRLFLCVEAGCSLNVEEEAKLHVMLKELRILAQVQIVAWDQVLTLHWQRQDGQERGKAEGDAPLCPNSTDPLTEDQRSHPQTQRPQPAVRFLYLPRPPADRRRYPAYLHHMDLLSRDLGPTLLIHGITPVVTTYF